MADEKTLEEEVKAEEYNLEDLNELIHSLRKDEESYGQKRINTILKEQITIRENQILTMEVDDLGGFFEMLRLRGERIGILTAMKMPETVLEMMLETREALQEEEKENEDVGTET